MRLLVMFKREMIQCIYETCVVNESHEMMFNDSRVSESCSMQFSMDQCAVIWSVFDGFLDAMSGRNYVAPIGKDGQTWLRSLDGVAVCVEIQVRCYHQSPREYGDAHRYH